MLFPGETRCRHQLPSPWSSAFPEASSALPSLVCGGMWKDKDVWRQLPELGQEGPAASGCPTPDEPPCPLHPGTLRAHLVLVPALSATQPGHRLPQLLHYYCHERLQGLFLPKQGQNHGQILRDPPSPAGMKRLPLIKHELRVESSRFSGPRWVTLL